MYSRCEVFHIYSSLISDVSTFILVFVYFLFIFCLFVFSFFLLLLYLFSFLGRLGRYELYSGCESFSRSVCQQSLEDGMRLMYVCTVLMLVCL